MNKSGKIRKIKADASNSDKKAYNVEFAVPYLTEDEGGIISSLGQPCEDNNDLKMLTETFFKKTFPNIKAAIKFPCQVPNPKV